MSSHSEASSRVRGLWQDAQNDPFLREKMVSDPRTALREAGVSDEEIAHLFSNHPHQHMTEDHWNHWTSPADHDHSNGH